MHWFSQGGRAGRPGAQHNLGMMYEGGKGVPQDKARPSSGTAARPSRATRARSSTWRCATTAARAWRAMWARPCTGSARRPSRATRRPSSTSACATTRARTWRRTAQPAILWYGRAGRAGPRQFPVQPGPDLRQRPGRAARRSGQALDWYRRAAEQGHAGAQDNLGLRYEHGQGVSRTRPGRALVPPGRRAGLRRRAVPPGPAARRRPWRGGRRSAQAVAWYRKAAEQGHLRAQFDLGLRYESGAACRKTIARR
jgi:TPR repeat protein